MRIVLLGDLHLFRRFVWPWQIIGKRLLGQSNLWFNRQFHFLRESVPQLISRAVELDPDVVIACGDVSTTALAGEFADARRCLAPLYACARVFILPGNHDRYTFSSFRCRRFERFFGEPPGGTYPWHVEVGERLHVLGLDAARPTWIGAHGELGEKQLKAAERLLSLEVAPGDRVIVHCHYPLATPPGLPKERASHALRDADRLIQVLARSGRDVLYVHGHVHHPWCFRPHAAANVVAINAGAPVMRDAGHPSGQGFWQLNLRPGAPPDLSGPPAATTKTSWTLLRHIPSAEGWKEESVAWPEVAGVVSLGT